MIGNATQEGRFFEVFWQSIRNRWSKTSAIRSTVRTYIAKIRYLPLGLLVMPKIVALGFSEKPNFARKPPFFVQISPNLARLGRNLASKQKKIR